MMGYSARTDENGEIRYFWDIIGYEMKQPRHSFVGLSVNTDNTVDFTEPSGKLVPRQRIIPSNPEKYEKFCRPDMKKKAFYCPTTHALIINNFKVKYEFTQQT